MKFIYIKKRISNYYTVASQLLSFCVVKGIHLRCKCCAVGVQVWHSCNCLLISCLQALFCLHLTDLLKIAQSFYFTKRTSTISFQLSLVGLLHYSSALSLLWKWFQIISAFDGPINSVSAFISASLMFLTLRIFFNRMSLVFGPTPFISSNSLCS